MQFPKPENRRVERRTESKLRQVTNFLGELAGVLILMALLISVVYVGGALFQEFLSVGG